MPFSSEQKHSTFWYATVWYCNIFFEFDNATKMKRWNITWKGFLMARKLGNKYPAKEKSVVSVTDISSYVTVACHLTISSYFVIFCPGLFSGLHSPGFSTDAILWSWTGTCSLVEGCAFTICQIPRPYMGDINVEMVILKKAKNVIVEKSRFGLICFDWLIL